MDVPPDRQQLDEDDGLQNDLPVISADDAADIRRYLKQHQLQVSEIHLLEGLLLAQLEDIDSENTRTLCSDEIAAQSLSNDITKVQEATGRMGEWLRHHDRQLNRMKVGISQIEHRNRLLDLQERNHTLLADTLQNILDDLRLDDDIINELKSPSILLSVTNFSAFTKTVSAAQELNSVLQKRFLNGLENLASVREKREEFESIRKTFCEQVVRFFSNLFQNESKKLFDATTSIPEIALPENEKLHLSLGKFEELTQVLESIDKDAFVSLRQVYTRQMSTCYSTHFSLFFQTQKKNIVKEKRDNSLNAMPAATEPTVALNRGGSSRSVIRDSKRTITTVFESALEQALHVLVAEQDFCLDFFGFKLKGDHPGNAVNEEEMDRMNEASITEMMKLLFKGLEEEYIGLADKGDEMDHLYSLKMLVKIEQLQQQYARSCHYAEAMLSQLRTQTKVLFEEFTKEQLAWIENLKVSTKRCGILPPFARLPAFIERMESAANCYTNRCATVDDTYIKVIECMVNWLPQVALQEPKYKTLVMMENFHFFWRTMVDLSIPCLSNYSRKAFDMYKEHRDLYVSWSVKYEFSKAFEFFELLESTASSLSSIRDVPFTPGLSKQDLRTMVKTHLAKKKIQKGVSSMLQRLIKHLGEKHPLLPYVWTCMSEFFVSSFKKFEILVSQCYQAEEIGLTADDINSAFSSGSGEALIEKLSESAASRSIVI